MTSRGLNCYVKLFIKLYCSIYIIETVTWNFCLGVSYTKLIKISSSILNNKFHLLLFCPSWSCTIICCINRITSLCKNLFNLLEFLAEAFRWHVHHFQCLTVPVELDAMFRFIVVGIAEMLLWLLCLIVSKSLWDL